MKNTCWLLFLFSFAFATGCVGCGDRANSPWDLDEDYHLGWHNLEGPPAGQYYGLGEIAGRHYFWLGQRTDGHSHVGVYVPGEGWRRDDALGRVLTGFSTFGYLGPRIVEHKGEYFVANEQGSLYRSRDLGRSWQFVNSLPQAEVWRQFASDGEHLYLSASRRPDARYSLWVSSDGEEWQAIEIEDLSNVSVLPRGVAIVAGRQAQYSADGARTWYDIDNSCLSFGSGQRWLQVGDEVYRIHSFSLERFHYSGCQRIAVDGLDKTEAGFPEGLVRLYRIDDQIFAFTNYGRLGLLEKSLTQWTPVPLPHNLGAHADVLDPHPVLFDLGAEGIGVVTSRGFWRSGDLGASWHEISHHRSTIDQIFEHDDTLFTFHHGHYQRPIHRSGEGAHRWEPVELVVDGEPHRGHPFEFVEREGRIFALGRIRPEIYTGEHPLELTTVHQFSLSQPIGALNQSVLATDIFFADGRWFAITRGNQGYVALPQATVSIGYTRHDSVDGGIFVTDSIDDPDFRPFGSGLPLADDDGPATLHSAQVFGDQIFVLTGRDGVFRADLATGHFTAAHTGLPTAVNAEPGYQIQQLRLIGDTLYAFSADAVFVWNDPSWSQVSNDSFIAPDPHEIFPLGITNLLSHRDRLLVVSYDGLYWLNPASGTRDLLWSYDQRFVRVGAVLDSGLYLGLENGGLWHLPTGR